MDNDLSVLSIKHVEYWALIFTDEFRPNGVEWPEQFATRSEAQIKLNAFIKKGLGRLKEVEERG